VKIVLLDEAQERFEAEDGWWREHRDAKELFVTEFEETLRQIASAPGIGQRYRRSRGQLIRRVLMKRTRCHVYYVHHVERDLVEIHSIWGARRRRRPALWQL
jgi:plasmid stabilization system protein ParE